MVYFVTAIHREKNRFQSDVLNENINKLLNLRHVAERSRQKKGVFDDDDYVLCVAPACTDRR